MQQKTKKNRRKICTFFFRIATPNHTDWHPPTGNNATLEKAYVSNKNVKKTPAKRW